MSRPPEFLQPLAQGRNACLSVRIVRSQHYYGEAPHTLGLLRARRERPRCRAAEQRDELATFQLIELHSFSASQGRVAGYRIASDQSAGMLEFCNQCWFCLR
jgi:hypothetical protein